MTHHPSTPKHQSSDKQYQRNEWFRQHVQSQDLTEGKVKSWDRLAEGPKREHIAFATQREH